MTIHIIINDRNEEVAAYTDRQQASLIAEELEEAGLQRYRVEELVCEIPAKGNDLPAGPRTAASGTESST